MVAGTRSNPLLTASEPELRIEERGYLVVDENGMTSAPGIFAGGDIVRAVATVILAMRDGKRAAASIEKDLDTVGEIRAGLASASPRAPTGPAGRLWSPLLDPR